MQYYTAEFQGAIKRKSNFEIMRIVAMIMICMCHYCQYGTDFNMLPQSFSYNVLSHYIGSFGKVGVGLFMLITGYFMIDGSFKFKNFLKILLNTVFYSWLFLIIFFNYFF